MEDINKDALRSSSAISCERLLLCWFGYYNKQQEQLPASPESLKNNSFNTADVGYLRVNAPVVRAPKPTKNIVPCAPGVTSGTGVQPLQKGLLLLKVNLIFNLVISNTLITGFHLNFNY